MVKNGRFRLGQKRLGFIRDDRREEPLLNVRLLRSVALPLGGSIVSFVDIKT